jgi:XTP/dITP diphosphohydrolase
MHSIVIATANKGKLQELAELLADLPIALSSLADHFSPLPEIPETGATFLENALQKADWVRQRCDRWVLADDSGLEVDFLGGRPGVLSARFAGIPADSAANNRLLLKSLEGVEASQRTARFRCTVVLVITPTKWFSATGACEGTIAFAPRGSGGFGYDSLFVPAGHSRTFGEMTSTEKHPLSHRGIALRKMRQIIDELCTGNPRRSDKSSGAPETIVEIAGEKLPNRSNNPADTAALASAIAHELNNPLCAVAGFSSALLARINAGESIDRGELKTYLQVIHDEAFRCRDIVEHLQRYGTPRLEDCGKADTTP